jgi:hypothetical protein
VILNGNESTQASFNAGTTLVTRVKFPQDGSFESINKTIPELPGDKTPIITAELFNEKVADDQGEGSLFGKVQGPSNMSEL